MSRVSTIRGVGFLEVAENFCFFESVCDPPLETPAETWKNAANVGAARLLRTVHTGDNIGDLEETTQESKKDISASTLLAVRLVWPQISSFVPTHEHGGAPTRAFRLQALWKAADTRRFWSGRYVSTLP